MKCAIEQITRGHRRGENGGGELRLSRLQRELPTFDNALAYRAPRAHSEPKCGGRHGANAGGQMSERHGLPFSLRRRL